MTMRTEDQSDNAAVVITDLEGRVLHRSRRISEILGRSNDEVIGKVFDPEWFAGASLADARDMLTQCLNSGSAAEHQLICRDRDGHEFPLWVECSLVTDNSGEPVNITWLIRDTESRRQLQEALAESKEKYRHLFEFSPESIVLLSLEGVILDCNQTSCSISGFDRDQLVGRSFLDLKTLAPENRTYLAQTIERLVANNEPGHFEIQILRGGVEPRWTENFASILTSDGKPYAIQVITRDITDKKKIEQALRESEQRYGELFDSISEGVCLVDQKENISFCNPACAEIFDVATPDDLIGRNLLDFVVPDQHKLITKETGQRKLGRKSQYDLRIRSATGVEKVIRASVSPRQDSQGKSKRKGFQSCSCHRKMPSFSSSCTVH